MGKLRKFQLGKEALSKMRRWPEGIKKRRRGINMEDKEENMEEYEEEDLTGTNMLKGTSQEFT